jgi:hypothetical protein
MAGIWLGYGVWHTHLASHDSPASRKHSSLTLISIQPPSLVLKSDPSTVILSNTWTGAGQGQ